MTASPAANQPAPLIPPAFPQGGISFSLEGPKLAMPSPAPLVIESLAEHAPEALKSASAQDIESSHSGTGDRFLRAAGLGQNISPASGEIAILNVQGSGLPNQGLSASPRDGHAGLGRSAARATPAPRLLAASRSRRNQAGFTLMEPLAVTFGVTAAVFLLAFLPPHVLAWGIAAAALGTGAILLTRHRGKALFGVLAASALSLSWLLADRLEPPVKVAAPRHESSKDRKPDVPRHVRPAPVPKASPIPQASPAPQAAKPAQQDRQAARPVREGLTPSKDPKSGKWGFVNDRGELVIAYQFERVSSFLKGQALVAVLNAEGKLKFGIIDQQGRYLAPAEFDEIRSGFEGGRAVVGVRGPDGRIKYGYIDENGRLVGEAGFDRAYPFQGDRALVSVNGKFGIIDPSGRFVVDPRFDRMDPRAGEDGTYMVGLKGNDDKTLFGHVDEFGRPLYEPTFEAVRPFSGGLAAAMQDGKWGFIDRSGRWIIQPQFARVLDFTNGRARVSADSSGANSYYIDPYGRRVD